MLSLLEYQVLKACSNDYVPFYVPFALINFGGPVFEDLNESAPAERTLSHGPWTIKVQPHDITHAIRSLAQQNMLKVYWIDLASSMRVEMTELRDREFNVYKNYRSVTLEDHRARFSYGPHEFRATDEGKEILEHPDHRTYRDESDWPDALSHY